MQSARTMDTTILPGHRIEVVAPELPEGAKVRLIVMLENSTPESNLSYVSMTDLMESLPQGPRSAQSWDHVEQNFQYERNPWER